MRVTGESWLRATRAFLSRRGLVLAVIGAWLVLLARSLVFIVYPQSFFDSDQAIVGLMAKHLIEGRAFPLFCGITVAAADYWRAYKLTFLSRERVQVASRDRDRAQEEGDRLLVLRPEPCESDQPPVHGWYLCPVGE
jgi:hypothetical protein